MAIQISHFLGLLWLYINVISSCLFFPESKAYPHRRYGLRSIAMVLLRGFHVTTPILGVLLTFSASIGLDFLFNFKLNTFEALLIAERTWNSNRPPFVGYNFACC